MRKESRQSTEPSKVYRANLQKAESGKVHRADPWKIDSDYGYRGSLASLLVFALYLGQGATLGLSDDEAYYWVLAQQPALAYAFHPPGVAWMIAFFEKILVSIFGNAGGAIVVRFPAALSVGLIFYLSLEWLRTWGLRAKSFRRASSVLLSFVGFFSLAWMMVPDIPLFLGWTLTFVGTSALCFNQRPARKYFYFLTLGSALMLLGKYSGILSVASAYLALLFWGSSDPAESNVQGSAMRTELKGRPAWSVRHQGLLFLTAGVILGLAPSLIWNAQHHWSSLLYQIYDRQRGDPVSFFRYAKFWGVELLLAGPVLLFFSLNLLRTALSPKYFKIYWQLAIAALPRKFALRNGRNSNQNSPTDAKLDVESSLQSKAEQMRRAFIGMWMLPAAAIFCVQPLFADFKPHWALIVWWPAALYLSSLVEGRNWRWIRYQVYYGLPFLILIWLSCQLPIVGWAGQMISPNQARDPRHDVTNDFYGWPKLAQWMDEYLIPADRVLPIVGSRYQTAAQATFYLSRGDTKNVKNQVTFLPRDLRGQEEWPDLQVSNGLGPEWPRLTSPVLYVTDIRYDLAPQFPDSQCEVLGRLNVQRWEVFAKWLEVWRCKPPHASNSKL